MEGRLSSLIRRIRNAVATWCECCPKIRKKKQSPSVAIFSQPKSNKDKKTRSSNQFARLLSAKLKWRSKRKAFIWQFYCSWFYCAICFVVRYMFFSAILTATIEWRPNELEKKGIFHLHCIGGRWLFQMGRPNLNGGTLTTDGGTRSFNNLSTGCISILGLWPCFIAMIPLRCKINISCFRVKLPNDICHYFNKLLFSNCYQKLNEMQYLKHFCA